MAREQCPASYMAGKYEDSETICCLLPEGHKGPHLDSLGDWNVRVPLWKRTRLRFADAEHLLRRVVNEGVMGDDWDDAARSWLAKQDRATQAGGADEG